MEYKMKYYLGLYLFLKKSNLLSMSLDIDFRTNLCRAFNLNTALLDKKLEQVEAVLDMDVSDLYLQFTDEE